MLYKKIIRWSVWWSMSVNGKVIVCDFFKRLFYIYGRKYNSLTVRIALLVINTSYLLVDFIFCTIPRTSSKWCND